MDRLWAGALLREPPDAPKVGAGGAMRCAAAVLLSTTATATAMAIR
jgi:hypothetical protein